MPTAKVALKKASLTFFDVHAVATHNPFPVNDVRFSQPTGIPLEN